MKSQERLAAATAARQKKMMGKTPHERAAEKIQACVDWLWRWGWSTPEILKRVSGAAQPIAPKLESLGYCKKTRIASGGFLGRPQFAITLTPDGIAKANYPENFEANYSDKIRANQIEHDLSVQHVVLKLLHGGAIQDYTPARLLEGRHSKIPDALLLSGNFKIALEVENEEKTQTKFDLFATRLINFLQESENHMVMILSDRSGVLKNYTRKLQAGNVVNIVKADGKGSIQKNYTRQYTIDPGVANRILINTLTQKEKKSIHGMVDIFDDEEFVADDSPVIARTINMPLQDKKLESIAQNIANHLKNHPRAIFNIEEAIHEFVQDDSPWTSYTPRDFQDLPRWTSRPGAALRAQHGLNSLATLPVEQEAMAIWRAACILQSKQEDLIKEIFNTRYQILSSL